MVISILAIFDITVLRSVAAAILLNEYLSDFLFDMDAGIGHSIKSHGKLKLEIREIVYWNSNEIAKPNKYHSNIYHKSSIIIVVGYVHLYHTLSRVPPCTFCFHLTDFNKIDAPSQWTDVLHLPKSCKWVNRAFNIGMYFL